MDQVILNQVNKAIGEAIKTELIGYNKPLSKICERVLEANNAQLFELINGEFHQLLDSKDFKVEMKAALNSKLAKTLVSRMGGDLEKQVNHLKADPTTRAKVTLAIDKIISEI